MSARYVLSQPVVLDVTFTVSGTLTDPTTVTLLLTAPDATTNTYTYAGSTITRSSLGAFTKTVTASQVGVWSYVWTGTGTAADVQDGTFTVFDDVPLNLYGTLEELKSRLAITNTNDDAGLLRALHACCGWIDTTHCQDFFAQVTATRTFEADDNYLLNIPSLVSVTTLKTDTSADGTFATSWTANTDYRLRPFNPSNGRETRPYDQVQAIGSKTFPYIYRRGQRTDLVQIAGVWGWPSVPFAVKEAHLILAEDTFKLKDAPFNVAGFDTYGAVRVKQNGQALDLLSGYRRNAVVFA